MKKIFIVFTFLLSFTNLLLAEDEFEKNSINSQGLQNTEGGKNPQILKDDLSKFIEMSETSYYKVNTSYPITAGYRYDDEYIYITVKSEAINSAVIIGFTRADQEIKEANQLSNIDQILVTYDKKKNAYVVTDGFARKLSSSMFSKEKQNVELVNYEISKGYVYFRVKRKLVTGDKFDFPLAKDTPFKMVFVVNENYEKDSSPIHIEFNDITLK